MLGSLPPLWALIAFFFLPFFFERNSQERISDTISFLPAGRHLLQNSTDYVCADQFGDNPESERCYCSHSEEAMFFLNYAEFHYCTMDGLSGLSLVILLVLTLFLFFLLATSAEEYLVPAVQKLSSFLKLPPTVAGVTLLAFGNGAADVMSSYASFIGGKASIGVGAILGAGMFVVTCVLGLVILFAGDFQAQKADFLRDGIFAIGGVLWLEHTFADGSVALAEAVVFVTIYFVYVFVAFYGTRIANWIKLKITGAPMQDSSEINLSLLVDETSNVRDIPPTTSAYGTIIHSDSQKWTEDLVSQYYLHHFKKKGRTSIEQDEVQLIHMPENQMSTRELLGQPERNYITAIGSFFRKIKLYIERVFELVKIPFVDVLMKLTIPRLGEVADLKEDEKESDPKAGNGNNGTSSATQDDFDAFIPNIETHFVLPGDLMTKPNADTDDLIQPRELSFTILFAPLLICFTFDREKRAYVIVFTVGAFLAAWMHDRLHKMPVINRSVLGGMMVVRLPWSYRCWFYATSFGMSVIWIYMIAENLVSVLATLGAVMGLSPSILGMTVLAWGNSIGDLFADVLLARGGQPVMASAGCWGGPLFNLLIGLGLGLCHVTILDYPKEFVFGEPSSEPLAFYFLITVQLFSILLLIFVTKFVYKRAHAFGLVCVYLVFLICCVLSETGQLPAPPLF